MKTRRYLIHLILIICLTLINSVTSVYADIDPAIWSKLVANLKEGQTAFYNQNYPLAEQDFKIAVVHAKAIGHTKLYAYASSYLGFSQIYLDKIDEAEATLKHAEQPVKTSDMPEAKMVYLLAYIEFHSRRGDIATAQKYIQTTLTQPDDYFKSIAITKEPLLIAYKKNQILEKTISELSTPSQAENYIEDALFNGKVMHWNAETRFIRVYISPGNHIQGWNQAYADNFKKACLVWQGILNNKIQFEFVENPNEVVDTVVVWNADNGIRAATTSNEFFDDKFVKADIVFHLIDNSNQLFEPRTIYKLSLHELGHLLGIHGHSRNPDDIMFPATTYAVKPSARDASTLLELYSRPAQITSPRGKTLSEYRKEVLAKGKHPVSILSHF